MTYVLSAGGLRELDAFLEPSSVLVFDYDGTLAPIVDDPLHARMSERTRRLVFELTSRARCVLLTGRSLAQMDAFVPDVPFFEVIGNHGSEWSRGVHRYRPIADRLRVEVMRAAGATAGAVVEDKGYSLSVHTREIRRVEDRDLMSARLAAIEGVKIVPGKRVLNVLAAGAPDKGQAVRALHEDLAQCRFLFVGDDVTDEYVFALGEPWLFSVRVDENPGSKASHFLRSQSEMDVLLEWLVARYGAERCQRSSSQP